MRSRVEKQNAPPHGMSVRVATMQLTTGSGPDWQQSSRDHHANARTEAAQLAEEGQSTKCKQRTQLSLNIPISTDMPPLQALYDTVFSLQWHDEPFLQTSGVYVAVAAETAALP